TGAAALPHGWRSCGTAFGRHLKTNANTQREDEGARPVAAEGREVNLRPRRRSAARVGITPKVRLWRRPYASAESKKLKLSPLTRLRWPRLRRRDARDPRGPSRSRRDR